ncbi:Protein N-terminal and lysine N-methyltransferase efm7 [Microsporum ferrugineum]
MGLELEKEEDEATFDFGDVFKEPEGFLPPPKPPTFSEHRLLSGDILNIRLVGSHPLYGYLLWNAARTISDFLEEKAPEWVEGKDILELGAGAGLPSIICAIKGAKTVVVTDYPDSDLVDNMRINASACEKFIKTRPLPLHVEGYKWGASTDDICSFLQSPSDGFDVLILADVIYNHPQHHNLIDSVKRTLKRSKESVAFVVFTPYQPWLLEKITAFFPKAEESGFEVKKLFEKVMDKLLFEDDPGDEQLRRTVFGYELKWKQEQLARDMSNH